MTVRSRRNPPAFLAPRPAGRVLRPARLWVRSRRRTASNTGRNSHYTRTLNFAWAVGFVRAVFEANLPTLSREYSHDGSIRVVARRERPASDWVRSLGFQPRPRRPQPWRIGFVRSLFGWSPPGRDRFALSSPVHRAHPDERLESSDSILSNCQR